MVPKSVRACLAAIAFIATTALMPAGASAASRGGPQPGTWNWPPYTGRVDGMPKITCGYVWLNPHRHKPGSEQWVYQCH